MFKTILFPVDQSRESQDAAETVAKLVKFCDGRLFILSVQVEDKAGAEEANPAPDMIDQLLQTAKSAFAEWGIEAETLHKEGQPAFCICDVADELDADVIVMGCRGVGLTDEGMAESVSNRVINLAPCPVLVVP
ncbi:TRAP-T-associated universal stress protein TeaD [Acaryochloris thomasi RCC1774]|uniref:TRAP-T-associated universal stress protein TeaD n=1 Tax=Acaryochloris thomasi RCC1774 TaxID=1764569 RepID=A0A2W1JRB4_9CYAN|nr:universal stress protein [Acaryochloris thomasi]PZD73352.1 TRAP-T-associated universal stress protein TeaD [Acaryochloris thomasi RCC1774]